MRVRAWLQTVSSVASSVAVIPVRSIALRAFAFAVPAWQLAQFVLSGPFAFVLNEASCLQPVVVVVIMPPSSGRYLSTTLNVMVSRLVGVKLMNAAVPPAIATGDAPGIKLIFTLKK